MLRVLDLIFFTLTPLNWREYLVAQALVIGPVVIWVIVLWGRALAGFPFAVTWLLATAMALYSFAFSVRRLLDAGVETKAEAALWVLGCNAICNLLAMGGGKSILPVTYVVYYLALLLAPSARPRPMWTQDLRR
jgi:hypothetical protein